MSLTSEGENGLIKYNVSRYDDSMRGEVETAIPLMIRGISQKDRLSNAVLAYAERWPVN